MLNSLVRDVALARKREGILKSEYDTKKAAFEAETSGLRESLKEASAYTSVAESRLRVAAVEEWKLDGNKQQTGTTIKVVKHLVYTDKSAMDWALEHKLFLELDRKGFETYAKKTPPDFVRIDEEATAAIASDLSEFLE